MTENARWWRMRDQFYLLNGSRHADRSVHFPPRPEPLPSTKPVRSFLPEQSDYTQWDIIAWEDTLYAQELRQQAQASQAQTNQEFIATDTVR